MDRIHELAQMKFEEISRSAGRGLPKSFAKRKISQEVNRLFAVYRLHTNGEPMAGGAQNLLFRGSSEPSVGDEDKLFLFGLGSRPRGTKGHINGIPIQLKLYILTFLGPSDLSRVCQMSQEWYFLASDELLWASLLQKRLKTWDRIYDDKNPDFYKQVCPELPAKHIYIKCHPNNPTTGFRMPNLFNYIVQSKPRVVMFGPGLETRTSKLVRSILTDHHVNAGSRFKVTGMVPGEFSGVGSGISLKFENHAFNLVTLYSNTKSVRQRLSVENRVKQNKLFIHEERRSSQQSVYELTPSIQELCRRSDAFIFVVDATRDFTEINEAQAELFAMLCEIWSSVSAPLLVLACSRGTWSPSYTDAEPLPPIEIVRALRLGRLKRKWLVQSGEVETLHGVRSGVQWLLSNVHFNFGSLR